MKNESPFSGAVHLKNQHGLWAMRDNHSTSLAEFRNHVTRLNPTDLANDSGTASHTFSDTASGTWGDMTSFIFSLGGEELGTIDEIRVGTTLASVTPFTSVPEPASLVMFGMCGIGMLTRRRR